MSIEVVCPKGHSLKIPDRFAGKTVLCPKCKARTKVPEPPGRELSEEAILEILGPPEPPRARSPAATEGPPPATEQRSRKQRSKTVLRNPKMSKECVACLDSTNRGIVLVRESVVHELMESTHMPRDRAAASVAAQLGLITCRGSMLPQELVRAAASMVARAEVQRVRSGAEVADGLPRAWHVPVYCVFFR